MPVVGLNLTSINARMDQNKKLEESVSVNSSPTIEKVEKHDVGMPDFKDVVAIKFSFDTYYSPKIGEISMEGTVLFSSDKSKEIIDKWTKEKKLEESIAVEVMNVIFRKCLTQAISLSAELRLPPPLRFPIVKPKDDNEYTG